MFLTRADLQRITNRTRYGAQRRALERLGIRFIAAANGAPIVRVEWLDQVGRPPATGHRWDRLGGPVAAAAAPARPRR